MGSRDDIGWDLELAYEDVADDRFAAKLIEGDSGFYGANYHADTGTLRLFASSECGDTLAAVSWAGEMAAKAAAKSGGLMESRVELKRYDVAERNRQGRAFMEELSLRASRRAA